MMDSSGRLVNPFRCINCDSFQDIFDTPCTNCGQDKRCKKILSEQEIKPKVILAMFGCDVHLEHKLIEKCDYNGLDYETLHLRLMNEEVSLTPTEAAELRDYIHDWFKTVSREGSV